VRHSDPDGVQVHDLRADRAKICVDFDDGTAGEYELVLGADGIHSTVRRLVLCNNATVRPIGQLNWRFVTACPPETTPWSVMLGQRSSFLMIPIGYGRVYCYCGAASNINEPQVDDLDGLVSDFAQPVPDLITAPSHGGEVHRSIIEEVSLKGGRAEAWCWSATRARVLADCVQRLKSIPVALAAFATRRRIRTDWIRTQMHGRDRLRYLPSALRNNFAPRLRPKDLRSELPTFTRSRLGSRRRKRRWAPRFGNSHACMKSARARARLPGEHSN
jgi:FAD-dependent urate hydroxylase